MTASLVLAAGLSVWLAVSYGRLAFLARSPLTQPEVQLVPREVHRSLQEIGGSFEIRPPGPTPDVGGTGSVSAILQQTGINARQGAAVHGEFSLRETASRAAWLVILEGEVAESALQGSQSQKHAKVYGLVDAASGSILWLRREP